MRLSFGEQVKIVLSRQGITIKQLAEMIEEATGKKMSRQNLTQRLGRDNFQEQDMYMIADVLGCTMQINLIQPEEAEEDDRFALSQDEKDKVYRKRKKQMAHQVVHDHAGNKDRELTWYRDDEETSPVQNVRPPMEIEEPMDTEKAEEIELRNVAGRKDDKAQMHADRIQLEENERDITVGELVDIHEELDAMEGKSAEISNEELLEMLNREMEELRSEDEPIRKEQPKEDKTFKKRAIGKVFARYLKKNEPEIDDEPIVVSPGSIEQDDEDKINTAIIEEATLRREREHVEQSTEEEIDVSQLDETCVNPYTNKEYETNSVRSHPTRIGYVQVYDRADHKWMDMTEWAFLGYQERKKSLLGKDYEEPVYLD